MSAKTKIFVLRMKEIIYTGIFLGLALLLIVLFLVMLCRGRAGDQEESSTAASYVPGIYTSSLSLGREQVNVEVTVTADQIRSVALRPLSDSVAAMYPLMEPAMQNLADQIVAGQSLSHLNCQPEQKYTSQVLLKAVELALEKAKLPAPQPVRQGTSPT